MFYTLCSLKSLPKKKKKKKSLTHNKLIFPQTRFLHYITATNNHKHNNNNKNNINNINFLERKMKQIQEK
jgi:hypothetical protein